MRQRKDGLCHKCNELGTTIDGHCPAHAMTNPLSDVVERLRTGFQRVQASKRGDAPLDMQPVWDIINAVPEVIALCVHYEFENYCALEDALATIERLSAERLQLREALGKCRARLLFHPGRLTLDNEAIEVADAALSNTAEDTP